MALSNVTPAKRPPLRKSPPSYPETFLRDLLSKNGKSLDVAVLWDLYHTFLPAQSQLLRFFEVIKNTAKEIDPGQYEKVKDLKPSAGEYCIFADMLDDYVQKSIARKLQAEVGPGFVDYWVLKQATPRDLAEGDKRIDVLAQNKPLKISSTNEIFYAPFDKDDLLKKLSYAYDLSASSNIRNMAVHDALNGRISLYGHRRDYEHYNRFAERLQPQAKYRTPGVNSVYVDPDSKKLSFDEKQVDVGLAVRAMELIYEENFSHIALVVSDTDFLPVFKQFSKRDRPYFLVHIQPIHDPKPQKRTRGVARGYKTDPLFDNNRVINVKMSELAYDVMQRISSELLNRAVLGSSALETELEVNRPIYDLFERLERDDYDQRMREEQEAYEAHMHALYEEHLAKYEDQSR